ncbi:MAG: homoserine dehydrogenase [Deltaproteobacteria bacterium]|nr:homoserine dehydrogenase [Deltaproteobacteria bacterium]
MKKLNIGLIGWGTVGTGMIQIMQKNSQLLEKRLGAHLVLKKVADLDLLRKRDISLLPEMLTKKADEVIDDPDIDILVELIGGIEPAKQYILKAIRKGKHVVTANKALLAMHGDEIFKEAESYGVDLGFEASVGGGIPVIRVIKEGLSSNSMISIYGILNGTTNYILTKMLNENKDFNEVLAEAQKLGYAEADPSLDIEGIDAAHKLAILVAISFGKKIDFSKIAIEGIKDITLLDCMFAKEFGYCIKLLGIAKTDGRGVIEVRVHPTLIPLSHSLASVDNVFNAIYLTGDATGPIMVYGKGAGMMPTGSAVVSDIIEIGRNIISGAKKRLLPLGIAKKWVEEAKLLPFDEIQTPYYIRFSAVDRPGVLSKISGILGNEDISIASVIQKGRAVEGMVPIVMLTHEAKEKNIKKAIEKINKLDITGGTKATIIRIENNLS